MRDCNKIAGSQKVVSHADTVLSLGNMDILKNTLSSPLFTN
jgi:hypothetical protein